MTRYEPDDHRSASCIVVSDDSSYIAGTELFVDGSQGACLATESVARNPRSYAGLIALTGGLIGPEGTIFRYSGDLADTPCFLGSGDPDP
jgi:phospholipase/carboxylesterase